MSSQLGENRICSRPSLLRKLSGKPVQGIMTGYHMHTALLKRLQTGILIQAIRVLGLRVPLSVVWRLYSGLPPVPPPFFLSNQGSQAVFHPHIVIKSINNRAASQTNDRIERFLIGELEGVQGIPDSGKTLRLNLLNHHKIPDLSNICRFCKELLVEATRTEICLRIIPWKRSGAGLGRRTCIRVHSFRYRRPTKETHYPCPPRRRSWRRLNRKGIAILKFSFYSDFFPHTVSRKEIAQNSSDVNSSIAR